jgi:hypothetical protein
MEKKKLIKITLVMMLIYLLFIVSSFYIQYNYFNESF